VRKLWGCVVFSSISGYLGSAADVSLVALVAISSLLGLGFVWTQILHVRHLRAGLDREQALLSLPLPADRELPSVLVQIPTFNEGALVTRILGAVAALDWPRDKLHIQVLDDSTDESAELARLAVEDYRRRGHDVVLLHRHDRSGFKAGALKVGLARSNAPFVAMFDADYLPQPDFLRRCLPALVHNPDAAFVQARCGFLNSEDNWLTRAQRTVMNCHLTVEQATRSWAGQILPFNGTCGVWRRAAIDQAGGWQGDTLTEDLDLSYRTQLLGWRAFYLSSVVVPGELPQTFAAWRKQQLRWNTGFAQNAYKLLPVIWGGEASWRRRLESTLHLGSCFHGMLGLAQGIALWGALLLGTSTLLFVLSLVALQWLGTVMTYAGIVRLTNRFLAQGDSGTERRYPATVGTLMLMHNLSTMLSAWGVLRGIAGTRFEFVRTPKTGTR
jgi:cellulose synthase/poly-beta-1,6-N-acetylglucosamine synthase-like glycosyltransferase